jgi:epoxide hydrolase-like predicted phosphatase
VQKIEAVLFDWGGVLIDSPTPGLMDYCAGALGVSVDQYARAHNRYVGAFERGSIAEGVFWQQVCNDLGRPQPQAPSLWSEAFRAIYSPREEVFALAGQLREKGYRTALLSNTEAGPMHFFLELRYEMFDASVFSCAEGVSKPQKEIYEIAARRLRTQPERCVVVDDKPAFVEGARNADMKGIVYESLPQVKQELTVLGIHML